MILAAPDKTLIHHDWRKGIAGGQKSPLFSHHPNRNTETVNARAEATSGFVIRLFSITAARDRQHHVPRASRPWIIGATFHRFSHVLVLSDVMARNKFSGPVKLRRVIDSCAYNKRAGEYQHNWP